MTGIVGKDLYENHIEHQDNISDKEYEEMLNSPVFFSIRSEIINIAESIDSIQKDNPKIKLCTYQLAKNMLVDSSPSIFENSYGVFLPSINNKLLFNVNSYKKNIENFNKNKSKLINKKHEQDHIPSYYALENFFNLSHDPKKRIYNLNQNATAIDLNAEWHKKGRTWGKRNNKDYRKLKNGKIYKIVPVFKIDGNDLKIATVKDFTIMAYIINRNASRQEFLDFMNSFPKLYLRNKLLCLYDI